MDDFVSSLSPAKRISLFMRRKKYEVHEILSSPSADPRSDPYQKIRV